MKNMLRFLAVVLVYLAGTAATPQVSGGAFRHCTRLRLPIESITARPDAYQDFCDSAPAECNMSGAAVIELNSRLLQTLDRVNREVNAAFRFHDDLEWRGKEEKWRYPDSGGGDCEDLALEKRRRLVAFGLPRAAMTMSIVYHQEFKSPHALLLVETSDGTIALDSPGNAMLCWNQTPYNYESRERPDGLWERFDQTLWRWRALH